MIIGVDFSIWNTGLVLIDERHKIGGSILIQASKDRQQIFYDKLSDLFVIQALYKKGDFISFGDIIIDIINLILINLDKPSILAIEGSAYGGMRRGLEEQFALRGIFEYLFLKNIKELKKVNISPLSARKILFGSANPLNVQKKKIKEYISKRLQRWISPYSRIYFNKFPKKDREHIYDATVIALAYIKKIKGVDFNASDYF